MVDISRVRSITDDMNRIPYYHRMRLGYISYTIWCDIEDVDEVDSWFTYLRRTIKADIKAWKRRTYLKLRRWFMMNILYPETRDVYRRIEQRQTKNQTTW